MMPFLAMLQGAGGAAGAAGGGAAGGMMGRLGQAIGTKGAGMIQPSNKNIGMQYANMGLTPPPLPDVMTMLTGLQNLTQQQGGSRNLPTFINMIRGGQ